MIEGLPKYDVALQITHNNHKTIYMRAEDYLNEPEGNILGFDPDEWISRADFDAAIATDSIWEIVWWARTPVAYCNAYGSTFDNALAAASKDNSE